MSSIPEINNLAITELASGNEFLAQSLLRKNAKIKSCCLTLNNLGVYYTQYGMLLKNGKNRSAKKIGYRYLLKAATYESNWRNLVNIATAACEHGDFTLAYQLFLKAHQQEDNVAIQYNIGACLFRLQRWQEATTFFEMLCSKDIIQRLVDNGGQNPFLILAYCQSKLHNKLECVKNLQQYRETWKTEERLDVFCLRYLCGMYEEALSECVELLEEWYPTSSILAMIADCLSFFPTSEFAVNKALLPEQKKLWESLRYNPVLRAQKVQEYSYLPPLICMYHFILV